MSWSIEFTSRSALSVSTSFLTFNNIRFSVVRAQPVDLFPLTPHYELVFLLLRGEARKRFEVQENEVKIEVKPERNENDAPKEDKN